MTAPTPGKRARQDQEIARALTWSRAHPDTAVVVLASADPGVECCWCDCPDDMAAADHDGDTCAGCPADARYVGYVMLAGDRRRGHPLCAGHRDDFRAVTDRAFRS